MLRLRYRTAKNIVQLSGKFHKCVTKSLYLIRGSNSSYVFRKISQAGIRINDRNTLRMHQARFSEEINNTETRRNFHHSYEKIVHNCKASPALVGPQFRHITFRRNDF